MLFRTTICLTALSAMLVAANDNGKTSDPPAHVIGGMISVTSSVASSSGAALMLPVTVTIVTNAVTDEVYEAWWQSPWISARPDRDQS